MQVSFEETGPFAETGPRAVQRCKTLADVYLVCVPCNGFCPLKERGSTGVMWWDLTFKVATDILTTVIVYNPPPPPPYPTRKLLYAPALAFRWVQTRAVLCDIHDGRRKTGSVHVDNLSRINRKFDDNKTTGRVR